MDKPWQTHWANCCTKKVGWLDALEQVPTIECSEYILEHVPTTKRHKMTQLSTYNIVGDIQQGNSPVHRLQPACDLQPTAAPHIATECAAWGQHYCDRKGIARWHGAARRKAGDVVFMLGATTFTISRLTICSVLDDNYLYSRQPIGYYHGKYQRILYCNW